MNPGPGDRDGDCGVGRAMSEVIGDDSRGLPRRPPPPLCAAWDRGGMRGWSGPPFVIESYIFDWWVEFKQAPSMFSRCGVTDVGQSIVLAFSETLAG